MLSASWLANLAAVYWQQKHFPLNYKYKQHLWGISSPCCVAEISYPEAGIILAPLRQLGIPLQVFQGQETEMLF